MSQSVVPPIMDKLSCEDLPPFELPEVRDTLPNAIEPHDTIPCPPPNLDEDGFPLSW